MAEAEGVIKFNLTFEEVSSEVLADVVDAADLASLTAWRSILKDLELLGQTPGRYDGYGFGNVSLRQGEGFVISGTQTGGLDRVTLEDYAFCSHWDLAQNAVFARGAVKPSSESLSHASIYDGQPQTQCALHVHSPEIWQTASDLGVPITDPGVAYGTPEMADEVARLLAHLPSPGLFTMGGHEDGVFTFGTSLQSAGALMIKALARAREVL